MNKLPKYIEKALQNRTKYMNKALINGQIIDDYAKNLGIDICEEGLSEETGCFASNLLIFTEPSAAEENTRQRLLKALDNNKK